MGAGQLSTASPRSPVCPGWAAAETERGPDLIVSGSPRPGWGWPQRTNRYLEDMGKKDFNSFLKLVKDRTLHWSLTWGGQKRPQGRSGP